MDEKHYHLSTNPFLQASNSETDINSSNHLPLASCYSCILWRGNLKQSEIQKSAYFGGPYQFRPTSADW